VANLGIFEEKEVVEATLEVQTKYLEITTIVLEKIDIPVERAGENIPTIQVNTNEEQTKEEVVVIGVKQPEKEIKKGKVICMKQHKKKLTNQVQVGESQMSLAIDVAMSKVRKEWKDVVD
jgi:hypothetical protein